MRFGMEITPVGRLLVWALVITIKRLGLTTLIGTLLALAVAGGLEMMRQI